ncbi:MAG: glycosyltransferase family 2 protein [Deltaproteobacteria bacterium]|nr:glycosyltransferase family 2 protein [Deltaproteobacteria bacterium]
MAIPLVCVIIPTFNRGNMVGRAISSVLYQTFQDYEIIVVDDGSADQTLSKLRPFERVVRILKHETNRGVSAARNTAIRESSSPLIAFLDSDDYWLPDKLRAQVEFFKDNPEALACQTQEIWVRNGQRVNPGKKHQKLSGHIFEPSLKLCMVSPSSVMLRRTLLDEVGLFDEELPVCEDYDLWLRVTSRYPVYLINKYLVVKDGGRPDQLSRSTPAMDRFRIKALVKLIQSGALGKDQRKAALDELSFKCRIYANGCLKRGRKEEGRYYLDLPQHMVQFCLNTTNSS